MAPPRVCVVLPRGVVVVVAVAAHCVIAVPRARTHTHSHMRSVAMATPDGDTYLRVSLAIPLVIIPADFLLVGH